MDKQLNNEVILIGKMISGLYRIQVNNKKACRVLMKVIDGDITANIPVIFINPTEGREQYLFYHREFVFKK